MQDSVFSRNSVSDLGNGGDENGKNSTSVSGSGTSTTTGNGGGGVFCLFSKTAVQVCCH